MNELSDEELVKRLRESATFFREAGFSHDSLTLWEKAANRIEQMRRGEFICGKCGLRKDGEKSEVAF